MSTDTLTILYKLFEELNTCTLELNNLDKIVLIYTIS